MADQTPFGAGIRSLIGNKKSQLENTIVNLWIKYSKAFEYKDIGYTNMTWDEEVFNLEGIENVKWVKSTNYKVDGKSLG